MKALLAAVALRVLLVATYLAFSNWVVYSDVHYYFDVVAQSDLGRYPYLQFWMEYPPVFPLLAVGLYRALQLLGLSQPGYFYLGFALFMSLLDVANLLLLHRLARLAYGLRRAGFVALIYAGLPTAIWFSLGWFDALAVLALMAGLLATASGRPGWAGALAGIGAMTKLFPVLLVLPAIVALRPAAVVRMLLVFLGVSAAIVMPLLLISPQLVLASFVSLLSRQPWETIWAVVAGSYYPGMVPRLEERFVAESAYQTSTLALGPLALLVQIGLGLLALRAAVGLARLRNAQLADLYRLLALGVTLFLLGSKGFSTQFVTWLLPLILLAWPTGTGFAYVSALTLYIGLYSYPTWLEPAFSSDYGRIAALLYFWAVVLLRTAILALLAYHLFRSVAGARPGTAAINPRPSPAGQ